MAQLIRHPEEVLAEQLWRASSNRPEGHWGKLTHQEREFWRQEARQKAL